MRFGIGAAKVILVAGSLVLATASPANATLSVTTMQRGGLPYTDTDSAATGAVHAYSSHRTGSAEAWSADNIGARTTSSGEATGLANGWAASAYSYNIISTSGLAPGERIQAGLLVQGMVSLRAYSGSSPFSLGQAYASYGVRTLNSVVSHQEVLQLQGGYITSLSGVSEDIRIRFTPIVTLSGKTDALPLTEDDLVGLGFAGSASKTFDSFTTANAYSLGQANAIIAAAKLSGIPSLSLGPVDLKVSWDMTMEFDKQFIVPLTLGRSDYLQLNLYTDVLGNANSGGAATISLGNSIPGDGQTQLKSIRVFVPDESTRDLSNLTVRIGSGFRAPVERYSDVFGLVPEPATWLMLLVGFGLLGAALRQREAKRDRPAVLG